MKVELDRDSWLSLRLIDEYFQLWTDQPSFAERRNVHDVVDRAILRNVRSLPPALVNIIEGTPKPDDMKFAWHIDEDTGFFIDIRNVRALLKGDI